MGRVVLVTAAVLGAGDPGAWAASPAAALPDLGSLSGGSYEANARAAKVEQERRNSPAARADRRASRARFGSASRAEALSLARAEFPSLLRAPLLDGDRPAPGMVVGRRVGDRQAVVRTPEGERVLLASTTPLSVRRGGRDRPVDLALEREAGGFATAESVVPLQIGDRAPDGMELVDADVTVRPVGARDSVATATEGRLFFAEVERDTDYVAVPMPDGGEVSWLLRSPQSPERLDLAFDLPEGARLQRPGTEGTIPGDRPKAIFVVKGGETIAVIKAPVAYDADGVTVPVATEIAGDRVSFSVEHAVQPVLPRPDQRLLHRV